MRPRRQERWLLSMRPGPARGFSLIEMLVVIAVIGILAALLLPALAQGKSKAQGLYCLTNHRQLCLAWRMYSDENQDQLPYASENPWDASSYSRAWVTGTLDFDGNNAENWDPTLTIEKSPLWPYCGNNHAIWKCPSDRSYVVVNGETKPRVRSMSMNVWLGGWGDTYGNWDLVFGSMFSGFKLYTKQQELSDPGPANLFVFLDMRSDSIDMGNFCVCMAGWPNQTDQYRFFDLPGYYHHFACGFSFADGHSEMRRWRDSRTIPPMVDEGNVSDVIMSPDSQDIAWLQARATRPK